MGQEIAGKVVGQDEAVKKVVRAIQRWVDDIITDYIIENNPEEGTKFLCDYNKEDEQSFIKPIHTPSEIKELQEHLLPEVKNDDVKVEKPKRTRKKKDE